MNRVAGVDTSTQACKVVVCEADTGRVLRTGKAPHPDGTETHPDHWWDAFQTAARDAGGLDDVSAIAVGGQQHGLVCLDERGEVIRPALLWNDTRSAPPAEDLIDELGGPPAWADAVGTVPVASITITKLRWLADHEPDHARRIAAVALPHDWLTWRLRGGGDLADLVTDRSDASGTGYFDGRTNAYRTDLLALALRRPENDVASIVLPRVLGPNEAAGPAKALPGHPVLGPGCGDNAGAALGLGLAMHQSMLSVGTSGVVASVSDTATSDPSGLVAGFSDAAGAYLPLACTLNGSRVLDSAAALLGVSLDELSALALAAEPGAGGLVMVPYLEGERTPNLPSARGSLHGMSVASLSRENYARSAVEGLLGLLGFGLHALRDQGVEIERIALVGGGARSEAVRVIAPAMLGLPVEVPPAGEYVALGAAKQAAWVLSGERPEWVLEGTRTYRAEPAPRAQQQYAEAAAAYDRTR